MSAGEKHLRKPLPSKEEIAKLPADGGPEFNRLIFTQSPYLLQHARNPVDWHPWGKEAFEKAKKENKPVFLSVGYTTCHWCHVMEHETFEDEEVAKLINKDFIAVKVDREERPDIDEVYMTATQALTGRGGWPMTVFMTPDKDPFFTGTYFPKESSAGRYGFKAVLGSIKEAWAEDQDEVIRNATIISTQLSKFMSSTPGDDLQKDILDQAFKGYQGRFDQEYGGFGRAPKFPVPPHMMVLLRHYKKTGDREALAMVEKTLIAMRLGGVYDQVGYGLHRYSTDRVWLLPHFEKMLYDQALVAMAYIEVYQVTGDEFYANTAREILTYVLRDMTSETGGFYSAEDADSEGEEGTFYIWSIEEIKEVLGEKDGQFFIDTYNATQEGNFIEEATRKRTGTNIPHLQAILSKEDQKRFEPIREKLFQHREKRIHPQKDDKILTDWNGLMIAAFARAGIALGEQTYIDTAQRAADFVLKELTTDEGRLLKRYRKGDAGLTAHLEDYAFMIWGLLDVYESTFETQYFAKAIELQKVMDQFFWDEKDGGYFMTASDSEKLIVRAKKLYGGAIPGGNAVEVLNLNRLYRMTGDKAYASRGDEIIKAFSETIVKSPMEFPMVLVGLDFKFGPSQEIVICGDANAANTQTMLQTIRQPFIPNKVVMLKTTDNASALAKLASYTKDQQADDGKPTAFVCEDFTCQLPTTDIKVVKKHLKLK